MISILRRQAYERLVRLLDLAVTMDPSVAESRHTILAPLRMLDALAREIPAALGDDREAMERLRLLVTLSAAYTPPTSLLGDLGNLAFDPASHATTSTQRSTAACPSSETIIHFGALVLVGVAASRIGAELGLAQPFLDQVQGLAVAAGPAEALARAAASGLDSAQTSAVLAVFMPGRNGDRHLSAAIGAFLADPCERARWACLHEVFALIQEDSGKTHWDDLVSGFVSRVTPATACPGELVTVHIATQNDSTEDFMRISRELVSGRLSLAFASTNGPVQLVGVEANGPGAQDVQVRVPESARPGWVGLTRVRQVSETNGSRQALRVIWADRNGRLECLRRDPVPTELIPDEPAQPAPPRHAGAEVSGGDPVVGEFSVQPSPVDAGNPATVRWSVQGADTVAISLIGDDLPAGGTRAVDVPATVGELTLTLTARSACQNTITRELRERVRGRIADVVLRPARGGERVRRGDSASIVVQVMPEGYAGRCEITLTDAAPAAASRQPPGFRLPLDTSLVTRAVAGRVRLIWNDGTVDDDQPFGPFELENAPARRVFFIRPPLVSEWGSSLTATQLVRVSRVECMDSLKAAGLETGTDVTAREPSWIDDEDLTTKGEPQGPSDPATLDLLERMHRLAARHPTTEDALWVTVLPRPVDRAPWAVSAPSEFAARVAVATLGALEQPLRDAVAEPEPESMRLRVVGGFDEAGRVVLEDVLEERRRGWSAVGQPTAHELLLLDAAGGVRARTALRTLGGPAGDFAMLVPLPAGVVALEVHSPRESARMRSRGRMVIGATRRDRPPGEGRVISDRLDGERLSWHVQHSSGARVSQSVELAIHGVWSPWFAVPPCADQVVLPVANIAVEDGDVYVRVRVCDGWRSWPGAELKLGSGAAAPVVVRRLADGRLWADADVASDSITWSAGELETHGAVIALPKAFTGKVTAAVAGAGVSVGAVTIGRPLAGRAVASVARSMRGYDD